MTDNHPITPPPELMQKWIDLINYYSPFWKQQLIVNAAHWGANQELDACCKLFESNAVCGTKFQRRSSVRDLRDKRRPKPPSLKEQALEALEVEDDAMPLRSLERSERFDTIRRALEALPNDFT